MDGIQEIDAVLQFVRQAAQQFHVPSDAAITQQILLFGDSFYGYRFTTIGFTAIWSATDQTLKMFDPEGQIMEIFSLSKNTAGTSLESISMPLLQRRAA